MVDPTGKEVKGPKSLLQNETLDAMEIEECTILCFTEVILTSV